ncbi:MAG: hypothetical protein RLZZ519_1920 [Bacteroidota bacterium]|jgi:hypothetical protein
MSPKRHSTPKRQLIYPPPPHFFVQGCNRIAGLARISSCDNDLDRSESVGTFDFDPANHVIELRFSVMEKLNVGAPLVQVLRLKRKTTMKTSVKFSLTAALLAIMMVCSLGAMAQLGKVSGIVKKEGKPLAAEKVLLYGEGGGFISGTLTDEDGKYEFAMLESGDYTIEVKTAESSTSFELTLSPGETKPMDLAMNAGVREFKIDGGIIKGERANKQLFTLDPMNPQTVSGADIRQSGGPRGIAGAVATFSGVVQKDHGDPMSFRGGRENASATYIDGLKLRGSDEMPLAAISNVTLLSGGIPAEYGDVTGGVILVTTRNPSMTMGHVGKPLTRTEKQMLKQQRKKGSSGGQFAPDLDLACN